MKLSRRQHECLALVALGKQDKAIAAMLGISYASVKTHLGEAYRRLNVPNRTAAAIAFREAA